MLVNATRHRLNFFLAKTGRKPDMGDMANSILTPDQVRTARRHLGFTQAQMADYLGLAPANGKDTVRGWEAPVTAGRHRQVSGPVAFCIIAMLEGYDPPEQSEYGDIIAKIAAQNGQD